MTAKPNDAKLKGKNALANSVAELNGPLENLKLEIPSLISNIVQFTLESQKIGATEPEKLKMTAKFKDDIKTELVGTLEDEAKRFKEDADDSPSSKMRSRT